MITLTNNYNVFNVGIYTRLSREDDNFGESESIQNQKDYITKFVIDKGWNIVKTYSDDGFTGTNFDRPGFKEMLSDIESHKINLVVTKDMSRLGRDHIDTGHYMERYFPKHQIRYIAINDGIDTFSKNSNNDMAIFRSVINDQYAKDISNKVKSVMDVKRNNGKFIGSFAPYGYKKNPLDKNKLVVDESTAPIVKRIYLLYSMGLGYARIANVLNQESILCPSAYKKTQNPNYNNASARLHLWATETVRLLLTNPTYIGNMAQNKYKKVNYKVKKLITIPRENWIVIENTHEPIIEKDIYDLIQKMIDEKISYPAIPNKADHLLSKLIYCGDCGERMTFSKTQKGITYCICSKYKRFKKCSRHSISEDTLEKLVIEELKKLTAYVKDQESLFRAAQSRSKDKKDNSAVLIKSLDKKLDDIKFSIKSLYADKIKGILSEQDFIDLSQDFNRDRDKIISQLVDIKRRVIPVEESLDSNSQLIKIIKEFTVFEQINRTTLIRLINRIEVFEDNKVVIHYKFKKPF